MKPETKDKLEEWYKLYPNEFDMIDTIVKQISFNNVCPVPGDILKAFFLCKYNNLKVVMLGQDPYPNSYVFNNEERLYATGLAFGNRLDPIQLSPSLDKIGKEAYKQGFIFLDKSLESWAEQGVLLLNSALTVTKGQIGSHTEQWKPFVSKLLAELTLRNPGLIVVLIGKKAQEFEGVLSSFTNIFKVEHPAAACYNNRDWDSQDLFVRINDVLLKNNNTKISW
jgi:uracil-DNA glycosylase